MPEKIIDKNRILAFSDAVFAFAATLLVLKIDISPALREMIATSFPHVFATLLPQYFANIITFLVIGYYWLNHHAIFGMIERLNSTVVWINLILLISVSFLPFSVDLYGDFPNVPSVVIFYSINVAIVGYLIAFLWWYVSHNHRLVNSNLSQKRINYYLSKNLVAPVVFTLSIPLVAIHPIVSQGAWIFIVFGILLINQIFNKNK